MEQIGLAPIKKKDTFQADIGMGRKMVPLYPTYPPDSDHGSGFDFAVYGSSLHGETDMGLVSEQFPPKKDQSP